MFAFDLRNADVVTYFYASSTSFPSNESVSLLRWVPHAGNVRPNYNYWSIGISNTTILNKTMS